MDQLPMLKNSVIDNSSKPQTLLMITTESMPGPMIKLFTITRKSTQRKPPVQLDTKSCSEHECENYNLLIDNLFKKIHLILR